MDSGASGIGASHRSGTPERFSDSRMDEIAVFSDMLTTGEIDQIRQRTYAYVSPSTTTTTTTTTNTTTFNHRHPLLTGRTLQRRT